MTSGQRKNSKRMWIISSHDRHGLQKPLATFDQLNPKVVTGIDHLTNVWHLKEVW